MIIELFFFQNEQHQLKTVHISMDTSGSVIESIVEDLWIALMVLVMNLIVLKDLHLHRKHIDVIIPIKFLIVMLKVILFNYLFIFLLLSNLKHALIINLIIFFCTAYLKFTCPSVEKSNFLQGDTRLFRSPHDCQHFFICVQGRPRLQSCGEGNAFNEISNACDAAENVTGWWVIE